MQTFYSNGKVLLTGEYLVLFGAKALAFPTQYGQDLTIRKSNPSGILSWKAFAPEGEWFQATFILPGIEIVQTSSTEKAEILRKMLQAAGQIRQLPFEPGAGYHIETRTNFPVNWGLGTSSTLINNIAQWANVNPFTLHKAVTNGSGYDIACANKKQPFVYSRAPGEKEKIELLTFDKSFVKNLYFVYSGRKKATQSHVNKFLKEQTAQLEQINEIDDITASICRTDSFEEFQKLMVQHEIIMSEILGQPPLKESTFKNFEGTIKSLGAWGGDFFMAASPRGKGYVQNYFEHFGLSTIIPFKEMVI